LDIGPDEHGKIPPIMEERLLQIGDWMKITRKLFTTPSAGGPLPNGAPAGRTIGLPMAW